MIILHPFPPFPSCTPITITCSKPFSLNNHFLPSSTVPPLVPSYARTWTFLCTARNRRKNLNGKDFDIDIIKEDQEALEDDDRGVYARRESKDIDMEEEVQEDDDGGGYSGRGPYTGRQEKDYDRDPEFAEILGGYLDDPQKAHSKIEERLRKKRNKILHTKTGSGVPMKVSVNKWFGCTWRFGMWASFWWKSVGFWELLAMLIHEYTRIHNRSYSYILVGFF